MLSRFARKPRLSSSFFFVLGAALVIGCAAISKGTEPGKENTSTVPTSRRLSSEEQPKRVLLLFGDDQRFPMTSALTESIWSTLNSGSKSRIQYHTEYLDRTLMDDATYVRRVVSLWQKKYENHKIDLIIVCFASALDLLSKHDAELFPGVQTVYCILFGPQLSDLGELGSNTTGVWAAPPFRQNVELALKLHPGTQRVVVVFGSSDADLLKIAKDQLRDFESEVEVDYLSDLTIHEYQERLAGLPQHTVVLYGNLTRDRDGHVFTTLESISMIAPWSAAPIYGLTNIQVGSGIVGGSLISLEQLGTGAATIGARILAGERPQDIPPQRVANVLMFDSRELKRWGISEESLPPGSLVLFRTLSFWDQYRWYAISLISVVIVQSLLIAGLVINRSHRKRAEAEHRRAEVEGADSRARLAGIIASAMDAIISVDERQRIVLFNEAAEKMFGCTEQEVIGQPLDRFIPERFREAHHRHISDFGDTKVTRKSVGSPGAIYGRRADGEEFPIEASISQIELHGQKFYTVILRDITERHQALEALRESEERFRNMAETAPVMIWIAGGDRGCIYINQQWLDFTGRTIEQELGDGWAASVHPDDYQRCLETYNTAFDLRQSFTMEYRLRGSDGRYRWIYDSGSPRQSPSGKFLGYIGSCIDITERKAAEEALVNLSGQLISAREDECARIARELHDDVNQRMALASMELDQLRQNPPDTRDKLRDRLKDVMSQIAETSREIHRMSYDLHPSKLVHLGLVAALRSLFEELHKRHGLKIDFSLEEMPGDLPRDVSLCLYRIAQECLNNVIKHSGAREAKVELRVTGSEIRLRVSDRGSGFEVGSPRAKNGLGLISMRERLRLVGGNISVDSEPSKGTRIDARVPLGRTGLEDRVLLADDKVLATGR